jgi:hypothetical protein
VRGPTSLPFRRPSPIPRRRRIGPYRSSEQWLGHQRFRWWDRQTGPGYLDRALPLRRGLHQPGSTLFDESWQEIWGMDYGDIQ